MPAGAGLNGGLGLASGLEGCGVGVGIGVGGTGLWQAGHGWQGQGGRGGLGGYGG